MKFIQECIETLMKRLSISNMNLRSSFLKKRKEIEDKFSEMKE